MSREMSQEWSHEVASKPYSPDRKRGKWESSTDFFYACLGHAFKIDAMIVLPSVVFRDLGVFLIIPYFTIMALCVVPIVFIQSFLGQFSSSGFISVFRIAPLFKGIGYISLALNLTQLTYYSVFTAIPLFYFFHSLRPTLPWSCEGSIYWMDPNETVTTPCNIDKVVVKPNELVLMQVPSLEFFSQHMNIIHSLEPEPPTTFSWSLVVFAFFVWVVVGSIISKSTELIGRCVRYICLTMLTIMGLCLFRFLFLPGALEGVYRFFRPEDLKATKSWLLMGMLALSSLGPGWGSILCMASYNRFKTNIAKYSWLLGLAQFGVIMGTAFLNILVTNHLKNSHPNNIVFRSDGQQWLEFLAVPTALTLIELPNLWSLLYFTMLILGSMNLVIVQLFSVLTSLFDEFAHLRAMKREVTWMTVGSLSLVSIYFCTNRGIMIFEALTEFSILTQMLLNLLLLLVVLWIYGRVRLQRDLQFMTSRMYAAWMIYVVRFITPIFLLLGLAFGLLIAVSMYYNFSRNVVYIVGTIIMAPWLLIPGVCVYRIMKTEETAARVLRQWTQPVDWHPADPNDRQRYEDIFCTAEMSHLTSVK